VKNVIKMAEKEGIKVGLIRPITLWPFPTKEYEKYADVPKAFLTVELNAGQMVEDVRLRSTAKTCVFPWKNGRNDTDTKGNIGQDKGNFEQLKF